jgi:hypothetical protein
VTTIDQAGPAPADERPSTGRLVLHFAAGFVITQVLCAFGLVLLVMCIDPISRAVNKDVRLPLKIGVASVALAGVAGAVFAAALMRRRFPLLLAGSIVGTVLGMMALGPCAFCFIAIDA